jgi:hypothetical protein
VDPWTYSIAADGRAVVFEVPQLRRGEGLSATIMHRGLATVTETTRIDQGEILSERPRDSDRGEVVPVGVDLRRYLSLGEQSAGPDPSDPSEFTGVDALQAAIQTLKHRKERTELEPIIDVGLSFDLILLEVAMLGLCVAVPFIVERVDFALRNKIQKARDAGSLSAGAKKIEVEAQLGKWSRTILRQEGSPADDQIWYYAPYQKGGFFGVNKRTFGAVLFFSKEVLTETRYCEAAS